MYVLCGVLCLYAHVCCVAYVCVCVEARGQYLCLPQLVSILFYESGSLTDSANWLASESLGLPFHSCPQLPSGLAFY